MIPLRAKYKNFLCYVDESIDFTKLPEIVCITGINSDASSQDDNNGAGKSSMLDGVIWALYGRVRGEFNKDLVNTDVIHLDENEQPAEFAKVEYVFQLDSDYKVVREITLSGKQTLEFYVSTDGKTWKTLTLTAGVNKRTGKKESSISRTQQRINDVLNANCDLFINSIFFEQGNTNTFASAKPAEREQLLREALYLEKWVDYGKEAKDKLRNIEKQLYAIDYNLNQNNYEQLVEKNDELEATIASIEESLTKTQETIKEKNTLLLKAQKEFKNLTDMINKINSLIDEITMLEHDVQTLKVKLDAVDYKLQTSIKTESELLQEIDQHEEAIRNATNQIHDAELMWSTYKKDNTNYESLKNEALTNVAVIDTNKKSLENKKKELELGSCPIKHPECDFSSCENKEKSKKKINSQILKASKDLADAKKELEKIEQKIVEQKKIDAKLASLDKDIALGKSALRETEREIESVKKLLNVERETIKERKSNRTEIERELKKKKDAIEKKTSERDGIDVSEITTLQEQIEISEQELIELDASQNDQSERLSKLQVNLEVNRSKIKDVEKFKEESNKLNDQKRISEYVVKILTKEIPHQLVEAALPEIETYAQEFLIHLSNGRMNMSFITQREIKKKDKETDEHLKTDALEIMMEVDGVCKKYALGSGGEKTRVDIAIHLGYSVFLLNRSGARLQTLFLDEVAASLDKTGKMNLLTLLQRLVKEYGFKKIFVISQDERWNRLFDSLVTVKRSSKGSKIWYSTQNT